MQIEASNEATIQQPQPKRKSGFDLAQNPEPIHEKVREAYKLATEAKNCGRSAVVAAWEAGCMLARVKTAMPRKFEPWVREHFGKSLSVSTCYRLIKLSLSPVTGMEKFKCLTDAYIELEILPGPDARKKREPDSSHVEPPDVVVERIRKEFGRILLVAAEAPVSELPEEARQKLRETREYQEVARIVCDLGMVG